MSLPKEPRELRCNDVPALKERARNEEFPFYKSLRQTNKVLCAIATPLLFEVVVLFRNSESWKSLNGIARSHLAQHVKVILVAALPPLKYFTDQQDWLLAAETLRGRNGILRSQSPKGGPFARLDFEDVDACFARYKRWRDGEAEMTWSLENEVTPELRLDLLNKLERLQTVGQNGLACIELETKPELSALHKTNLTRREIESCLLDEGELIDYDGAHWRLLVLVQKQCGVSLSSLALENLWELFRGFSRYHLVEPIFKNLRCLELSLLPMLDPCLRSKILLDKRTGDLASLAVYVPPLENLEELLIIGSDRLRSCDVISLLSCVPLPKLTEIRLQGVPIGLSSFKAFLDRQWETLVSLQIQDTWMIDNFHEDSDDEPEEDSYIHSNSDSDEEQGTDPSVQSSTDRDGEANARMAATAEKKARNQANWDVMREEIEATATQKGVSVDLSRSVLTGEEILADSRYRQYFAF